MTETPSYSSRKLVLDEAALAVLSDRNADYGDPEDNFADIAALWTEYVRMQTPHHLRDMVEPFSRTDVAVMMVLTKIARAVTSPCKADHWVDIAGYAACGLASALADAEGDTDE